MRSADTDMIVEEPMGPVEVQLTALEAGPPTRELWQQKWTASNGHFDRVFVTNGFTMNAVSMAVYLSWETSQS